MTFTGLFNFIEKFTLNFSFLSKNKKRWLVSHFVAQVESAQLKVLQEFLGGKQINLMFTPKL